MRHARMPCTAIRQASFGLEQSMALPPIHRITNPKTSSPPPFGSVASVCFISRWKKLLTRPMPENGGKLLSPLFSHTIKITSVSISTGSTSVHLKMYFTNGGWMDLTRAGRRQYPDTTPLIPTCRLAITPLNLKPQMKTVSGTKIRPPCILSYSNHFGSKQGSSFFVAAAFWPWQQCFSDGEQIHLSENQKSCGLNSKQKNS